MEAADNLRGQVVDVVPELHRYFSSAAEAGSEQWYHDIFDAISNFASVLVDDYWNAYLEEHVKDGDSDNSVELYEQVERWLRNNGLDGF